MSPGNQFLVAPSIPLIIAHEHLGMKEEEDEEAPHPLISYFAQEQYTDIKLLGKGSSATVFLAKSEHEKDFVALKCVPLSVNDFTLEKNTLEAIGTHSGILLLHRILQVQNFGIFVVEPMENDLMDLIESEGSVTEVNAKALMFQIFNAVSFFHEKGFAHLDLKPENILLKDENTIAKVSDFGTAIEFKEDSPVKMNPIGTFFYCAPEISNNLDVFPDRADVWSLGILTHVLLTGSWPFSGADYDEACQNAVKGVLKFSDQLNPTVMDMIEKMLSADPLARPVIRDLLKHPWFDGVKYTDNGDVVVNEQPITPRSSFSNALKTAPQNGASNTHSLHSPKANTCQLSISDCISQLEQAGQDTSNKGGLKTPRISEVISPRIRTKRHKKEKGKKEPKEAKEPKEPKEGKEKKEKTKKEKKKSIRNFLKSLRKSKQKQK